MNLSSTPSAPKSSLSPVSVPAASPPPALPSSKPPKSPAHSHNPPIVLRIFKGTAQLVTPVEEPNPPAAVIPVAVTPERKSRRRGHSTEIAGNVSPKRLRERHKGVSYTETDPDSEPDYEALSAPAATYSRSRSERATRSNSYSAPPVKVPEPIAEFESIPESTDSSSVVVPPKEIQEAETVEDISKQVENSAKIEEGENLLASTYVDFNAAEKKILSVKATSSNDVEREELLAVLGGNDCDDEQAQLSSIEKEEHVQPKQSESAETEWFSDSECSDTAAEQMNIVNENDLASQCSNEAQIATKTPKKRSIFKSRQVGGDSNAPGTKKRFGLYKHKWSDSDGPPGAATPTQTRPEPALATNTLEEDFDEVEPLTRVTSYPEPDADSMDGELVTSIKCTKKAKGVSTCLLFCLIKFELDIKYT